MAPSALQAKYGHEENLSRAIAESEEFTSLLSRFGAKRIGRPRLEVEVKRGHDGRKGRVDIYQATSLGDVVVEVQYGKADANHAKRLQNYAKSLPNTVAVIWVAESFPVKFTQEFSSKKFPVYCLSVKESGDKLSFRAHSPVSNLRLSHQKRLDKENAKYKELLEWYHAGLKKYEDETLSDHAALGWHFIAEPRGAAIPHDHPDYLDDCILRTLRSIFWRGAPKGRKVPAKDVYLFFNNPEFQPLKEDMKDEMLFQEAVSYVNAVKADEGEFYGGGCFDRAFFPELLKQHNEECDREQKEREKASRLSQPAQMTAIESLCRGLSKT